MTDRDAPQSPDATVIRERPVLGAQPRVFRPVAETPDPATTTAPIAAETTRAPSEKSFAATGRDMQSPAPDAGSAHDDVTRIRRRDPTHPVASQATRIHDQQPSEVEQGLTRQRSARNDLPTASDLPVDAEAFASEVAVGTLVKGQYRLIERIGHGGMGQVWRARDTLRERAGDPQPDVALKLLLADFEGREELFIALQREAVKTQSLAHPNVVTVFNFEWDRQLGCAFISMELLRGQTLDQLIAENRRGLGRAAFPLIRGIAAGLAYAHSKRPMIVHSDLKPGNVFVTRDGTPKILDFGIARAARAAEDDSPHDTFDAGSLGALTLAYASPEMLRNEPAAPADDVYALGLIACELVTGRPPFNNAQAADASLRRRLPRLPGLWPWQKRAIRRALAPERAKRWPDASRFLSELAAPVRAAWIVGLVVATLVAAGTAFRIEIWNAAQPEVAFEALPAQRQTAIRDALAAADRYLALARAGENLSGEAATKYAEAYALHPRNPDAARGLRAVVDVVIEQSKNADPGTRHATLVNLQAISDYYRTYDPLVAAIQNAAQGR